MFLKSSLTLLLYTLYHYEASKERYLEIKMFYIQKGKQILKVPVMYINSIAKSPAVNWFFCHFTIEKVIMTMMTVRLIFLSKWTVALSFKQGPCQYGFLGSLEPINIEKWVPPSILMKLTNSNCENGDVTTFSLICIKIVAQTFSLLHHFDANLTILYFSMR